VKPRLSGCSRAEKGNKEIATELGITVRTVETHRARIMLKMGFHSLTELIHFAIRAQIVPPPDSLHLN
jgi:DNA-binding NarL/FixJ family response regulator